MANDREIERKYLLRELPAVAGAPHAELDQGYLPGDKIRERVRRITAGTNITYFRTVKLGTGVERFEFEEATTQAFFDAVWPLTAGRRVRKRRYELSTASGLWEVDEFLDRDLILAEIEFESVEQEIEVPTVIRAVLVREVTHEPEFTNFRLSR